MGDTPIFAPGTVFTMPGQAGNRAYFYLEGPVTQLPDGLWAYPGGIALILYPTLIDGTPGASFFHSWPDGPNEHHPKFKGMCCFGNNLRIGPLPCGLQLHVAAPAAGVLRFYLESRGKPFRELVPILGEGAKLTVGRAPIKKGRTVAPGEGPGIWSTWAKSGR